MTEEVEKYLQPVLIHYDHFKQRAYTELLDVWPRFDNYNHFEKFVILNLVIIAIYLICSFIASFSPKAIYEKIMKIVFDLPPIKNVIMS